MKKRRISFGYVITEGLRGIFLHGFMSFAAVGVIVACLLIMGSFTLLAVNITALIAEQEQKNEITAYVDENLTDAEAKSVGSKISLLPNVLSAEFVSRAEALENFKNKYSAEQQYLFTGLEEAKILRHRYQITLVDIGKIDATVAEVEKIKGVAPPVRYDSAVASGFVKVHNIVQAVSLALIIVLLFVSVFIISNTVKLATFDRREEIGIMRIVGATKGFVRWPFVVEGFFLGTIASISAFFLQWFLYTWFTGTVLKQFAVIEVIRFSQMALPIGLVFVLTGFMVGVGGSLLTIRKFLKV